MELSEYKAHAELKKLVRAVAAGEYLFRQGEQGTTMFVVLSGAFELLAERDEVEHVEALLTAGQFLGEKALVQGGVQRYFSVRALEGGEVLELSLADLSRLPSNILGDMLQRSFVVASERLAKSNFLVRMLRSSHGPERIVNCIRFFCRSAGRRSKDGVEVNLSLSAFQYYLDVEPRVLASTLSDLVQAGLLIGKGGDKYVVKDENALLQSVTASRRKAA